MKLKPLATAPGSDVATRIQDAILRELPGSLVRVTAANPGHFNISVTSEAFRGQSRLACQRLVYKAMGSLLQGDAAPVHAVDNLETKVP